MAIINPISYSSQTASAGTISSAGENNTMDKDMFFKLFLAQLQNQDPLNPMDSTDMTAQLAQFSQLEKLSDIKNILRYSQLYLASLNNAQAVDFIGKEIEARGDSVRLSEGGSASLNYELMDSADSVIVKIYDENMKLVRNVEMSSRDAGKHEWAWDGKDNNGNQAGAGTYTFEISATDADGGEVEVTTYLRGTVTGVTFEDGITYLMLEGRKVAIGDIIMVHDQEVIEEQEPASKTEKALDILNGIGKFMKHAAPIAAMML